MKGGKKKYADRPVDWKISIPESLAATVSLILSDPLTGRPKHGARSRIIVGLLREWLEAQKKSGIRLSGETPEPLPED